jgi:hypothetical protein
MSVSLQGYMKTEAAYIADYIRLQIDAKVRISNGVTWSWGRCRAVANLRANGNDVIRARKYEGRCIGRCTGASSRGIVDTFPTSMSRRVGGKVLTCSIRVVETFPPSWRRAISDIGGKSENRGQYGSRGDNSEFHNCEYSLG